MKPRHFISLLLLLAMGLVTACQKNFVLSPPSPLATLTPTVPNTLSPTFTQSPIFTASPTFTLSITPSPTKTPTSTATNTPTNTPTPTGTPGVLWYESVAAPAFSKRFWHDSVVYNGAMWVIAGTNGAAGLNDVWSSSDGSNWSAATTAAAFSTREGPSAVTFGAPSSMYVMGGYDGVAPYANDAWTSSDGANWTSLTQTTPYTGRLNHTSLVYNNKIWIIGGRNGGGNLNDVWSSPDGVNWTQVLAPSGGGPTQFTPRYGHASVVYNNLMWVIGGFDGALKNDVWSSPDGITWTPVLAQGPPSATQFSGRAGSAAVVYNNSIYVIAGFGGGADQSDVWNSPDGITWAQVANPGAIFTARDSHTSLVFNGSMWVIAGNTGGGPLNDVWHSP